jgi:MFS family permease
MSDIQVKTSAMSPWQLLAAAFTAQAAISFVELGVPILAPFIKDGLGLSVFALGVLVAALNVGRLIGAVPAGQLADRLGERRVLVASGVGLAGFAALASTGSYGPLVVALVCAGVFSGAATPAGSRLILAAFPRERRGLPMGIRQAAIPMGGLLAAIALPFLADAWGWRATLAAATVAPLAGAAVVALSRMPTAGGTDGGGLADLAHVTRSRKIVLAGMWAFVFVGGQYALLTYLALYLEDDLGVARTEAFAMVAVANLTGVAGRLAWGWLSDRFLGSRRRPGLVALSLLGVLSTALLAAAPAAHATLVAGAGAALGGFCLIGWQGLWVTMVSELGPPGSAGTAVGFGMLFTNAGIVVWPPLLGLAADLTGSLRWSWVVLGAALVVALLPLSQIPRVAR